MWRTSSILILVFFLNFISCDKIKRQSRKAVNKTRDVVSRQLDRVFPSYHQKPDTESNKKHFEEHLNIKLTDDVKDIYAYGDFLGADYKVLIAFTCDLSTISKIVATNKMQLSEEKDYGLMFGEKFDWWNNETLETGKPYKIGKEDKFWRYLWYDSYTHTAYHEEYSL